MSFTIVLIALVSSVVSGGLIVGYFNATNNNQMIKLTLAFSGGFLLAIIFQHLLPDIYDNSTTQVGVFILLGFLVQLILEYFSGGIEHGHVHAQSEYKIPWMLFIALSIHAFIEGVPLGNQYAGIMSDHHHVHESLFWGIIFHQIPVSIALMTLFMNTKLSRPKSWLFLLLFALMTPLGAVAGLKITPEQLGLDIHIVLALVVGMFLHISTTIIFESSENHKFNLLKLISILIGSCLAMILY